MADSTRAGYMHDALFYGSTDELVAVAEPFLRAGLEEGEEAVLACSEAHNRAISDAMGADSAITFLPRKEIYQRAPSAVASFHDLMRSRTQAGVPRVRLVGETDFLGVDAHHWQEWGRFESACNQALTDFPLWSVCAYDTQALPDVVITTGELTHPHVRWGGARAENPLYVDPAVFLDLMADHDNDRPDPTSPAFAVTHVHDLYQLRHDVRALLSTSGADAATVENFLLATNEVATNALRHGEGPVLVHLWVTTRRFVCTVTDQGEGFRHPLTGYAGATGDDAPEGQFGLWLARQLCDEVTASHTPEGFIVRLCVQHTPR